jgi:hypothetical protein
LKTPDDNIEGVDEDGAWVEVEPSEYEDIENDSEEDESDW